MTERRPATDDAAERLWNSLGCPAWKLREIADALAQAREEALREAAAEADLVAAEYIAQAGEAEFDPNWIAGESVQGAAARIRALAGTPPAEPGEGEAATPRSVWVGPRGAVIESGDFSCAKCGHQHVGALGGICVGCPCPAKAAPSAPTPSSPGTD